MSALTKGTQRCIALPRPGIRLLSSAHDGSNPWCAGVCIPVSAGQDRFDRAVKPVARQQVRASGQHLQENRRVSRRATLPLSEVRRNSTEMFARHTVQGKFSGLISMFSNNGDSRFRAPERARISPMAIVHATALHGPAKGFLHTTSFTRSTNPKSSTTDSRTSGG